MMIKKHLNENVDGFVKINKKYVEDDKTSEIILTDLDENIIIIISMVLPKGLKSKAFDLMKVLLKEKHVTFIEI